MLSQLISTAQTTVSNPRLHPRSITMSSSRSSYVSTRFPRLQSATFEPFAGEGEVDVTYRSGASFKGQVHEHKKIGRGIFTWPNGARYEGEYEENVRNGKGIQTWPDGSMYDGEFLQDLRHGAGQHTWTNKETYKGEFFQDRRHGQGLYTWPDGSSYKGTLYMDRKEGFGVFQFANGNIFEGLYHEDEREGPGVTTYPDGTQDVGLWHGEKLIKICSAVPDAFSMKQHQDFEYSPTEHVKYLDMEETTGTELYNNTLKTSPSGSGYTPENGITEKVTDIFNNIVLDPQSLAINKEGFNKAFYGDNDSRKNSAERVKVWNGTPSMISMQKHFYKHKHNKKSMSYSVDKVIGGDRGKFKDKGPLEKDSEELIKAATDGNLTSVEDLLSSGKVSPDVADSNGHTPMIGATVNWHIDVINCLLNHGADVNKLTDEGCSALSCGSIFYYPIDSFRYNIAERYLKEPEDSKKTKKEEKEKKLQQPTTSHPQTTPRSILSKKTKKNVQTKTDNCENINNNGHLVSNSDNDGRHVARQQVRIGDNLNNSVVTAEDDDQGQGQEQQEFESGLSLKYYEIEVSDQLIERCATQLSMNEKVVGGRRSHNSADLGTVRHLAVIKNERERMKATLDLLLRRGADPNASGVPMPVLFFAIKAADVEMVKSLLGKGASTSIVLSTVKGGLAPLHISCAIPGEEGVQITELLLKAQADPDVRATEDDSFRNTTLMDEWIKDPFTDASKELLGGRTPMHIACARDDNYKTITKVVRLLLEHNANTNLLCNGFSPLALCIASGNDMAIDELLLFGNDVSLPLTHGVGSALCAATNTEYEYRRPIATRLTLIDKLMRAGANILAPIPVGPKRLVGTAVDYAYYMFHQDTYIAKTPYHALTHAERETFINRKKLLEHIGDLLRVKAVEREKRRMDDEQREGVRSASPSNAFRYIGAGAPLPADARKPKFLRNQPDGPMVKFEGPQDTSSPTGQSEVREKLVATPRHCVLTNVYEMTGLDFKKHLKHNPHVRVRFAPPEKPKPRKPLFKYCYQCGRSIFVRLSACTRCKEVFYCSKACKLKAWNARHKEECIRLGGRSRSPSPATRKMRSDSPTPATNPDKGRKTTVAALNKDKQSLRIHMEEDMESLSGMLDQLGFDIDKIEEKMPVSGPSSRQTSATASRGQRLSAGSVRQRPSSGSQVPRKGLSVSAKGPRQKDDTSGQYIDNYSFV